MENDPVTVPRRPQHRNGPLTLLWTWVDRSAHGIRFLVALWVTMAVLGLCMFGSTFPDRNAARELQRHGQWAAASSDVQVHVSYASSRGGGYHKVDGVRVHLPGVSEPVELNGLRTAGVAMAEEPVPATEGWQAPTAQTGYVPPLRVRLQRDATGVVTAAMAQVDYDYWTIDNSDPEAGIGMSVLGLVLLAVSLLGNRARLNRNDRRGHRRDRRRRRE